MEETKEREERQIREEITRAPSRKGRVCVTLPNVMKLDKIDVKHHISTF